MDVIESPATKFEDGYLSLQKQEDKDCAYVLVRHGRDSHEPIASMILEPMNTDRWQDRSVEICESKSPELGEIAYQLHFNDHVDRLPLPYGIALCCCSLLSADGKGLFNNEEYLTSVEFVDALSDLVIQQLRTTCEDARGYLPLYFVYYGLVKPYDDTAVDVARNDSMLMSAFMESKKYGVFRCVRGITAGEDDYIAVSAGALKSKFFDNSLKHHLRQIQMWPKVNDSDGENW